MTKQQPSKTDELVAMTVRLPSGLHKRVRLAAVEHDLKLQELVAEALEAWLTGKTVSTTAAAD